MTSPLDRELAEASAECEQRLTELAQIRSKILALSEMGLPSSDEVVAERILSEELDTWLMRKTKLEHAIKLGERDL
jgi:hypothetical protein